MWPHPGSEWLIGRVAAPSLGAKERVSRSSLLPSRTLEAGSVRQLGSSGVGESFGIEMAFEVLMAQGEVQNCYIIIRND
jgi:hypothetical protein